MLLDSYGRLLVSGAYRLIEQGNRDPTLVEIAHSALNRPLPTIDPWLPTDELGREVYQGVYSRCNKIREALQANYNIVSLPVTATYYDTGQRGRDELPTEEEVSCSIPRAYHKTAGLRVIKNDDHDLFLPVYLQSIGERAASTLKNVMRKAELAIEQNAISKPVGLAVMKKIDDKQGPRPRALLPDAIDDAAE
jgi:hypothetical protein